MKAETLALDDARWRELVDTHEDATPFHMPEWASTIADCYRFPASVLGMVESDGELAGGIPVMTVRSPFSARRWVSLPFTDACPLLLREGVDAEAALDAIRETVQRSGVSGYELRSPLPAAEGVYASDAGYNHVVPLGPDESSLKPNKGHRYSRNRAFREGVRVERGASELDMQRFYRLHTLTRRRHGVPVQPLRFFKLLQERVVAPGHGFVSSAWLNDELVAAGVYLTHGTTMVAKYHASDPAARDVGAGYVVDWDSMVSGCEAGFRALDLGRTDPGAEGLRLYKASWGATESPLVYSTISEREPTSSRLTGGDLSREVVRRSPPWVCRALGEVLYRWSA